MWIVVVYELSRRWYFDGSGLAPRRIDAYKFATEADAQLIADEYNNSWVERF